ncbi:MAG: hypothetical protein PHO90_02935 [Candidatus Pacebacteria bacterium]|nr:hypothetical protein [Candidatus Paceibacterota bacterium]
MNNFLKENWFKISLLIIIAGVFYWYGWRPETIRKDCVFKAENPSESNDGSFNVDAFVKEYIGENYFNEAIYNKCLLEHGLEK